MNKTQIEWVKNPDGSQGYTWNPITGCLNHTPEGLCLGGMFPCYAYKLAHGRLRDRYLANDNISRIGIYPMIEADPYVLNNALLDPFYPRSWHSRIKDPWERLKPSGIFVCDMGELFGDWVPRDWQEDIFNVIRLCPQHRFYLLTKQPQNLVKWSPFPLNCWVGVTVTKPEFLIPALDALDSIQCSVRYLSIEPMLAAFDVPDLDVLLAGSVDWLILGSQTKPYRPPRIEWVEEIVRACDKAGIPVFLKNNLWRLLVREPGIPPIWARGQLGKQDSDVLRQELP